MEDGIAGWMSASGNWPTTEPIAFGTKPMNLPWPENWEPLTRELAAQLEAELQREIPPGHHVAGMKLRAVAKRGRRDDVLFTRIDASEGQLFVIHLTWAQETDPKWPSTDSYNSMEDFLERWPREELDEGALAASTPGDYRRHVIEYLKVVTSGDEQQNYERSLSNHGCGWAPWELIEMWFDSYHPRHAMVEAAFTADELEALARFNRVLGDVAKQLPDESVQAMLESPKWRRVMEAAHQPLQLLKKGS